MKSHTFTYVLFLVVVVKGDTCKHEDGSEQNLVECTCGEKTCKKNRFCTSSTNTCSLSSSTEFATDTTTIPNTPKKVTLRVAGENSISVTLNDTTILVLATTEKRVTYDDDSLHRLGEQKGEHLNSATQEDMETTVVESKIFTGGMESVERRRLGVSKGMYLGERTSGFCTDGGGSLIGTVEDCEEGAGVLGWSVTTTSTGTYILSCFVISKVTTSSNFNKNNDIISISTTFEMVFQDEIMKSNNGKVDGNATSFQSNGLNEKVVKSFGSCELMGLKLNYSCDCVVDERNDTLFSLDKKIVKCFANYGKAFDVVDDAAVQFIALTATLLPGNLSGAADGVAVAAELREIDFLAILVRKSCCVLFLSFSFFIFVFKFESIKFNGKKIKKYQLILNIFSSSLCSFITIGQNKI